MSGHTPGPWSVAFHSGFSQYGQLVAGAWIQAGEYKSLANLIPVHECRDNAYLIAAAPELLEALRAFVDRYVELVNCGDCGHWNPEEETEVITARAAIAKAEGREP